MAMDILFQKIIINIPNSEAIVDCRLNTGIKDSDVTGYYISDNENVKNAVIDFFGGFKLPFKVDSCKTKEYYNECKKKIMKYKDAFKSKLSNFESNFLLFIDSDCELPRMSFGGDSGRYLRFDNSDAISMAFKGLLLGNITQLVIEKHNDYFAMYPKLRDDYFAFIYKADKDAVIDDLANVLQTYYDECEYKKTGIHLFGYDYYEELNGMVSSDLIKILDKTNISQNGSYTVEIQNGIKLRKVLEKRGVISTEIYKFRSKLNCGSNLIVYGTPGCGKSYFVKNSLIEEKQISKDRVVRTTFYQDYTNTDFVGQVMPKVNIDKSVTYEFNPGPFTIALRKAIETPNEEVVLVIEELNRGNAPSIFGDIFQLLDRKDGMSEYEIVNVNIQDYLNKYFKDKGYKFEYIKLPGNLSIYATMNTSDQNVFTLDTAFKRRWEFKKLTNKFDEKHTFAQYFVPGMVNYTWKDVVESVNEYIAENSDMLMNEDKQIGVYFVEKDTLVKTPDEATQEKVEAFAYKLLEYLWDDVVKFDRTKMFKNAKTFDQLILDYKTNGEGVFVDGIIKHH